MFGGLLGCGLGRGLTIVGIPQPSAAPPILPTYNQAYHLLYCNSNIIVLTNSQAQASTGFSIPIQPPHIVYPYIYTPPILLHTYTAEERITPLLFTMTTMTMTMPMMMMTLIVGWLFIQSMALIKSRISLDDNCNDEGLDDD